MSDAKRAHWESARYRRRVMKARTHYTGPLWRKQMSVACSRRWTPAYVANYTKTAGPKIGKRSKQSWRNKQVRARRVAGLRQANMRPAYRRHMAKLVTER
jgi:hypothetical protein